MRLRRLELRDFRAFIEPVSLDGLGPGVTVISGANEAGKSTLIAALEAALFERHKSTGAAVRSMQPHGMKVRPTVALEFELDGERHRIEKSFCVDRSARLVTPRETLMGESAEREMARLIEVGVDATDEKSMKRSSKERGLFGVLWVKQGHGFLNTPVISEGAEATLRASLESEIDREIGSVLGGRHGQRILDAARAEKKRYIGKRGTPLKALKDARAAAEACRERAEESAARLRAQEDRVAQLAEREQALRELLKSGARGRAEEELAKIMQRLENVGGHRQRLREAEAALRMAEAELAAADSASAARKHLIAQSTTLRDSGAGHRDMMQAADARLGPLQRDLKDAQERLAEAEAAFEAAESEAREAATLFEHAEAMAAEKVLRRRLDDARRMEAARAAAEEAAAAITVDDELLGRMRDARELLRTAEAVAQATAALGTVRFALQHEGEAVVVRDPSGAPVPPEGFVVTERSRFDVGALGEVEIIPAHTEDTARVAREQEVERLRAELATLLEGAGATSVGEAIEAHAKKRRHEADARMVERQLMLGAGGSVQALEDEHAKLSARVKALQEQTGDKRPKQQVAELRHRTAAAALERAEQARRSASERVDGLLAAVATESQRSAVGRAQLEAGETLRQDVNETLTRVRAQQSDAEVEQALLAARGQHEARQQAVKIAERALDDAAPTALEEEAEAARRELRKHADAEAALRAEILRDRTHLAAVSEDATYSLVGRVEEDQAALDAAEAELERVELAARAATTLVDALEEALDAARSRYLAPLEKRLGTYMDRFLPGANIELGASLTLDGLVREGRSEEFESLSVGTREQLAVLTRLAFADVMNDAGSPVPVVLDDVLVYSDAARFDAMQTVLAEAGKRTQILVFTCRPRDWRDWAEEVGAPFIEIDSLGGGGAA